MQSIEQQWENLTLADDFLFGKIMSDPVLCAEMLRRIFPNLDVSEIKVVETQKSLKYALHVRGVRFDILTSTARSIFDVEAQKRKLKDLHRRPRAYQIAIGYDALNKKSFKKSGSYENLPNTYVIFICTFDLFGKGRHIYTFQNFCAEDKEIKLDDGAFTIFLNTEGTLDDLNPELKNFLKFFGNGEVTKGDPFIKILDEKIKESKHNAVWRDEYMVLLTREEEKFAEGRNEGFAMGRNEGRNEGIYEANERIALAMLEDGKPISEILRYSRLSENVINNLAASIAKN